MSRLPVWWWCGALAATTLLAGCGHVTRSPMDSGEPAAPAGPSGYPSEVDSAPPPPQPTPVPTPPILSLPPDLPTATSAATPCAGGPSAAQVLAALRGRPNALPPGVTPSVANGPLCAGTWQYTVYQVPGLDQLQVVTKGRPDALTVVTAGTDVCTADVTDDAPAGIVSAAHCR